MHSKSLLLITKFFVSVFLLPSLLQFCAAQLVPASPPVADPSDTRFDGAKEDWTTPSLNSSSLRPVQPTVGPISDYPGYTVELLRVQWRFGDPLDLYIMKPKGVHASAGSTGAGPGVATLRQRRRTVASLIPIAALPHGGRRPKVFQSASSTNLAARVLPLPPFFRVLALVAH